MHADGIALPVACGLDPVLVDLAFIDKVAANCPRGLRFERGPRETSLERKLQCTKAVDQALGKGTRGMLSANPHELRVRLGFQRISLCADIGLNHREHSGARSQFIQPSAEGRKSCLIADQQVRIDPFG